MILKWKFNPPLVIVFTLAVIKLSIHLLTAANYGFFIDEFYFFATGQHLAWGYVDMPPLTALQAWFARLLFNDSILGIHLIPALAGAGLVLLTGCLVAELGGKVYAQLFAGISVLIAGVFLAADSYLSMNSIEPLIWLGCVLILVRLIKSENPRLWIGFGILAGVGLMNKETILLFGFALLVGMLLTPARKWIFTTWFLLGGAIALMIFLPNLVWMIQHQFPMFEMLRNIRASGRNVQLNPIQFLMDEILFLHPLTVPIWLAGLGWFAFSAKGKILRFISWAFIVTLGILLATQGRTYYLAPAFPMLFAGGSIAIETWLASPRFAWIKPAYVALLVIGGMVTAPLFLPVLPPETYIQYSQILGMRQPRLETSQESALPQLFADRFGWPEMVQTIAGVYQSLPPDQQSKVVILTGNYGQAGAVDFYGPKYGLPKAISGHQNYYLWGTRGYSGEVVIAIGMRSEVLKRYYGSVVYADSSQHPYSMGSENSPIYICTQPKVVLQEVWSDFKDWK